MLRFTAAALHRRGEEATLEGTQRLIHGVAMVPKVDGKRGCEKLQVAHDNGLHAHGEIPTGGMMFEANGVTYQLAGL